jgi:hypothetical protein
VPAATRLRHYGNLGKTEGRLRRMLRDFRFTTVGNVIQSACLPAAGPALRSSVRAQVASL